MDGEFEGKETGNVSNPRYNTEILRKKYDENPFMADPAKRFQVPTRSKFHKMDTAGPLAVVDSATGETTSVAEIRRVTTVDAERFVKLFVSHLNVFFELKPGTIKLMTALIDELSQARYMNGDTIYLNYKSIQKYFEKHNSKAPAKTTYMTALAELVEKGFVAPSTHMNLFYINPAIFFNGDRIRFVTEFRKEKETKQQKLEKEGQARLELE